MSANQYEPLPPAEKEALEKALRDAVQRHASEEEIATILKNALGPVSWEAFLKATRKNSSQQPGW